MGETYWYLENSYMVQRNSLKIMSNQVSIIKLQANGVFMSMYTDGSICIY